MLTVHYDMSNNTNISSTDIYPVDTQEICFINVSFLLKIRSNLYWDKVFGRDRKKSDEGPYMFLEKLQKLLTRTTERCWTILNFA